MSELVLGRLRLERHFFNQIQVEALPEREKGAKIHLEGNILEAQRTDDTLRFRLTLRINFGPANGSKVGYEGSVQAVGYFGVMEPYPVEEAKELVGTEGVFLLFCAIRELVCNLTARGPWPILRLPNVSFRAACEPKPKVFSKKTIPRIKAKTSEGKPSTGA